MPGPKPVMIPGTEEKRRKQVLVNMNIDEWEEFCDRCERLGISRSEGARRLVKRELKSHV